MRARCHGLRLLFLVSCSVFVFAGCRNCDLVEAELRTRERELRELHAEFARLESENDSLHREVRGLRQSPAHPTIETALQVNTLRQIVLGRQTGGYDDDACPGDEALMVVCEPRDGDGHAIKAPGCLYVELVEISPEGLKAVSSTWELSEAELRRTWRSGLLSNGYHVVLPWKSWPNTERARVVVRLTLPDGRAFEADKDVKLRLTAAAQRKPAAILPPVPEKVLPMPEKVPQQRKPPPAPPVSPPALDQSAAPAPARRNEEPATLKLIRLVPWPRRPMPERESEIKPAALRREGLQRTAFWTDQQPPALAGAVELLPPRAVQVWTDAGHRP